MLHVVGPPPLLGSGWLGPAGRVPKVSLPHVPGVGGKWDKLVANGRNVVIMTCGQEGSAQGLSHPVWRPPAREGLGSHREPVQILAALTYSYSNFSEEINGIWGPPRVQVFLPCLYVLKMISIPRQIFYILDAGMIARHQTVFFKAIRV